MSYIEMLIKLRSRVSRPDRHALAGLQLQAKALSSTMQEQSLNVEKRNLCMAMCMLLFVWGSTDRIMPHLCQSGGTPLKPMMMMMNLPGFPMGKMWYWGISVPPASP